MGEAWTKEEEQRFWAKCSGHGGYAEECEEWLGGTAGHDKRARVWFQGRMQYAARVAWLFHYRAWPQGLVCHTCDNPLCVRWEHFFLGTIRTNAQDAARKGRMPAQRNPALMTALHERQKARQLCKHGHSLSDAYVSKGGGRSCRTCVRSRGIARRAANAM